METFLNKREASRSGKLNQTSLFHRSFAVFNISLPTSWADLSDKQLFMVYGLFARALSAAEVKTLCFMKWNSLKVLATLPRHHFLIKRVKVFDKPNEQRKACFISAMARKLRPKAKEPEVDLSTRQIQKATSVLNLRDFLADNIGQSFVGVVARALDDNYRRYNH